MGVKSRVGVLGSHLVEHQESKRSATELMGMSTGWPGKDVGFPFWLWQSHKYVYIYIYYIFVNHSSADGHLSGLHVLATVNSAAVNIWVHESF